jgi:cytochrome c oxidase subunit 1
LWRARIRYTVPMLFALSFFFNFLIGGLSGVFLSDVPSDVTTHGSYFVMAHFHYTIVGGLVFALMGGLYYWLPKMTGYKLNERLGKIHFWTMFIFFNGTFFPLFAAGLLGEWQLPSPVPAYNFERIPVINSAPYAYGVPDAPPVADFGVPAVLPGGPGVTPEGGVV